MTPTTSPADASATDGLGAPPAFGDQEYAEALEAARVNPGLYAFVAHGLRPAPHHRLWLEQVRHAVETPGGRLLVVAPPGAAKSTYLSFVLPLWYLGNHPDRAVLAVTSSDTMARQFHGTVALGLSATPAHRRCSPSPRRGPTPSGAGRRTASTSAGVPPGRRTPATAAAASAPP